MPSNLVKSATNSLLSHLAANPKVPRGFPTDEELVKILDISRTTVRKVTEEVFSRGVAIKDGSNKILLRLPEKSDFFSKEEEHRSKTDEVEGQILEKLGRYELKPGDQFSELELATEFGANTVTVREALLKLSQTGLIEKPPRKKWHIVPLSDKMIEEIILLRKLYEASAIKAICDDPSSHEEWIETSAKQHQRLKRNKTIDSQRFSKLDEEFHKSLIGASDNRYIVKSYGFMHFVLNYHVWTKKHGQDLIRQYVDEHLEILDFLGRGEVSEAVKASGNHLDRVQQGLKSLKDQRDGD